MNSDDHQKENRNRECIPPPKSNKATFCQQHSFHDALYKNQRGDKWCFTLTPGDEIK